MKMYCESITACEGGMQNSAMEFINWGQKNKASVPSKTLYVC